jgi:hypothetical protein
MADAKVKDAKKAKDDFNNKPEVRQLYKQIRDIQAKQLKIHKEFELTFRKSNTTANTSTTAIDKIHNQSMQENENLVNQRTNMLVLLNDLMHESSIASMQTDKRYLYTIEYKNNNTKSKLFANEDIKYKEVVEAKPTSSNDGLKNLKDVGKTVLRKVQSIGNKVAKIANNKLDTLVNKSEAEKYFSIKKATAEQERDITKINAETNKTIIEEERDITKLGLEEAQANQIIQMGKINIKKAHNVLDSETSSGMRGGSNDINQRLKFLANINDINKLEYSDLIVVEYSTTNTAEIDKNITSYENGPLDFYQYIANFQEYIKNNNEGINMNYADRTKDRSLLVKKYPIHKYFTEFNKNMGFDYKSIRKAYLKDSVLYTSMVNYYDMRLGKFLTEFQNYKNNKNLDLNLTSMQRMQNWFNTKTFSSWFVFQNYYGFIFIIIFMLSLFFINLNTFTTFINSVYQRKMSLEPNIIDDSMYKGYAEIYSLNIMGREQYYEINTMVKFILYTLLFFLVVSINLWYLSDSLQGRLRVFNFIPIPYYSTAELYIFDKRANFVMYYGLIILIFAIIFNILYYLFVFSQSDVFKMRYESNEALQDLYKEMDIDLLKYLLDNNIQEIDGERLNTIDLKLAYWMYGGTEEELDKRIGKTIAIIPASTQAEKDASENKKNAYGAIQTLINGYQSTDYTAKEDILSYATNRYNEAATTDAAVDNRNTDVTTNVSETKKKRFKILLTVLFVKHYIGPKYKNSFSNIIDIQTDPLPNVFLYSKHQYLDGVLPQNYESVIPNHSSTFAIIKKPPDNFKTKKCNQGDNRYFCSTSSDLSKYTLSDTDANFKSEYRGIYTRIQQQRRKIKSQDSAIMYRIDIILSFVFMLLLGLSLVQIFLWLFFDNIDVYETLFIRYKSKLDSIIQIIVVVIILIVIL